ERRLFVEAPLELRRRAVLDGVAPRLLREQPPARKVGQYDRHRSRSSRSCMPAFLGGEGPIEPHPVNAARGSSRRRHRTEPSSTAGRPLQMALCALPHSVPVVSSDSESDTKRRTSMNTKTKILAASLGLALSGAVAAETIVLSEPEVRTIVTRSGYAEPVLIKRDHELWRVRSVNPAGQEVTIFVNADGELLGASDVARTRIVE